MTLFCISALNLKFRFKRKDWCCRYILYCLPWITADWRTGKRRRREFLPETGCKTKLFLCFQKSCNKRRKTSSECVTAWVLETRVRMWCPIPPLLVLSCERNCKKCFSRHQTSLFLVSIASISTKTRYWYYFPTHQLGRHAHSSHLYTLTLKLKVSLSNYVRTSLKKSWK